MARNFTINGAEVIDVMHTAEDVTIVAKQDKPTSAVCPYCGKLFRYRLIGTSICEIDLMDLTFGEAEVCNGTGL